MIALPAVAATVVLVHLVLSGSLLDLGEGSVASAPAVLALALGWGLLSRSKLPDTADSLAIALLTPLRGPLCDGVLALWPASAGGVHAAAFVSLAPLGWMLGRSLSSLVRDSVLAPLAGLVVGEALVLVGVVAWLPGAWSGPLIAVVVAVCVEAGRHRRRHSQGANGAQVRWEALPVGFALGTLVAMLVRIAPAYADPDPHLGSEVVLALALPALLVAWPASVLLGGERVRRVGFAVGVLALAAGLLHVDDALAAYRKGPGVRQALTWSIRTRAWEHEWLQVWWVWLGHFSAWAAVATGFALAPLRRSAVGPLALGFGAAWLAQHWVLVEPGRGPQQLLVVAAGASALAAVCAAWPRRGLIAVPLALAAPMLVPQARVAEFDLVLRVGEPEIVGFQRGLAVDTRLVSTFGPTVAQRDSRLRYSATFSERVPFVARDALEEPEQPLPDPAASHRFVLAPDSEVLDEHALHDEHDDGPLKRYYGVRVGGAAQHAGHEPHGPGGSVGRLSRVFALRGRTFVGGLLAEVVASDLVAAGLATELTVTSPVPLDELSILVLLESLGLPGFPARVEADPLSVLRAAPAGGFESVLLTPGHDGLGLSDLLIGAESLRLAAERLAPGGRCLAWLDTTTLDARGLRARLAAFGEVFGQRAAAFVEPRELDAPLVLMLGWIDDAGRPSAQDVRPQLPAPDRAGRRTRLAEVGDLASLLLADGPRLAALADAGPIHGRVRPVLPSLLAPTGWSAVRALLADDPPRLARVLIGAPDGAILGGALVDGLAAHGRLSDHLLLLESGSMFESMPDIDWAAFDAVLEHYARAAEERPDDPLLHLVVAARLEPLARTGHFQRFAEVFDRLHAEAMPSWRIAALHGFVLDQFLEHDAAREARARARELVAGRS